MTKRFIFLIFVLSMTTKTQSWSGRMWKSDQQRKIQQTIWRLKYYYTQDGSRLEIIEKHSARKS